MHHEPRVATSQRTSGSKAAHPFPGPPPAAEKGSEPAELIRSLRADIAQLQRELIATHRLSLLGSMSAMVAHEYNNLLTPVVARAQDALARNDVPAMQKALDRTLKSAQKAVLVAQRLLGLAGESQAALEPCSLLVGVQEALESMARPFEKDGLELHLDVPAELRVAARRVLLEQLLLNLLLNARQAMKGHCGPLRVSARREGDHVVIEVSDSGGGMPTEQLEQVINPFLAESANSQPCDWHAVGLGLNVCRTIAHDHGATIQIVPNPGPGCTVRLRWPAA